MQRCFSFLKKTCPDLYPLSGVLIFLFFCCALIREPQGLSENCVLYFSKGYSLLSISVIFYCTLKPPGVLVFERC